MNFNAINAFDASTRRPVKHKHIVLYIRLNFQTIFFFQCGTTCGKNMHNIT